ncbi:hypothetical protein [Jongsikchunia kroppenstedtii]|uniref:hypothetical protein n=1 Tax=Jongsikchunia kroppenstedtii TaxID=1121721 RepID=UPI001FE01700|nr:hypothetical protein [Jongsikchunia kroppenstedtii]
MTRSPKTSAMRRRVMLTAAVLGAAVAVIPPAAASAAPVPFQIQPASFGNPNGSFDVPAIHCSFETGPAAGQLTITGGLKDRWGCMPQAQVSWVNLTTMATGAAQMSNGLNGIPAEATLRTGAGQVVVKIDALSGIITPGVATVWVP